MPDQKSLKPVSNGGDYEGIVFRRSRQVPGAISIVPKEKEYKQNYILYRVKMHPVVISKETRDDILKAMVDDRKFIQAGEVTIMLNSITAIEPARKRDEEMKRKVEKMKKQFERKEK